MYYSGRDAISVFFWYHLEIGRCRLARLLPAGAAAYISIEANALCDAALFYKACMWRITHPSLTDYYCLWYPCVYDFNLQSYIVPAKNKKYEAVFNNIDSCFYEV